MFPGERDISTHNHEGDQRFITLRPTGSETVLQGEFDKLFGKLISKIVTDKIPCYFIQPHFDDNILSAGGLMRHFIQEAVPIRSITVMSHASSDNAQSPLVQRLLSQRGLSSPDEYINQRRAEDSQAMGTIGLHDTECDELGEMEVIFRASPHSPSPRTTGKVIRGPRTIGDEQLVTKISDKLKERLPNTDKQSVIFVPIGLGLHKDHLIVRDAVMQAFGDDERYKLVFYQDIPYAMSPDYFDEADHNRFLANQRLGLAMFGANQGERIAGIYAYDSELSGLFNRFQGTFGKSLSLPQEGYYLNHDPF